jgi:endonuclease G, mitochondrial
MKQYMLLALFLVMPLFASAQINQQCPQFTANGTPHYIVKAGDQELCRANYAVLHRCATKTPMAVFEHLTAADITGPAKRLNNFHEDPQVAVECRSTLKDYSGAPYDKGHMSPAGNNTVNAQIMTESFLLSNMVPQNPNNNRDIWRELESWERSWVLKGGDFYIISGPIYDPGYKTIGNGVGVPTRLFKIIHDKNSNKTMAYMMPNIPLPVTDLPKYQTTVSAIEQATGMNFGLGQ